ncbi:MAG: NAD(P)-dependent oxidoreductase [Comamonadaceae bacterium]|nr:MAG: NAD(P)-dependent oxidoreductase [Comamonadaceae bacterium]
MKIALLGGGVVGQTYGAAFAKNGATLAGICDSKPSDALKALAAELGVAVHPTPGEWLADVDMVISAVFGTVALPVFEAALPFLTAGTQYVDMTTADPEDMQRADALAKAKGIRFTDVAITGAVNLQGIRTPLLFAGADANAAAALYISSGSPVNVVGPKPGDAATLKLLRSIFTKGMEALAVECLVTAEKRGLREELHLVLKDIDDGSLRNLMESMVRTHIEHSGRRANEVIEAQRQMQAAGVTPVVMPAVQARFEQTVQQLAARGYTGKDTEAALQWLSTP